jgi:hypothetical protein
MKMPRTQGQSAPGMADGAPDFACPNHANLSRLIIPASPFNLATLMNRLLPSLSLCILAAACGLLSMSLPVHAQAPAGSAPAGAREVKDLVKSVEKDLGNLRSGSKKQDAAMEISKSLTATEVNKTTTLKFKVASVNSWHFPGPNITGWRVEAGREKFREGGVNMELALFAHFKEDPSGKVAKLKKGQEIIVSGKVTRCDITALNLVVLHVDMGDAVLEDGKK